MTLLNSHIIVLHALFVAIVGGITVEELTSGSNMFTAAVYREVAKINKNNNILVSPFSAQIVVSLAQSGAKNETAQEIRRSLYLPDTKEETEAAFKNILPTLKGNREYSLEAANKIYIRQDLPIREEFKKVASDVYRADLESIDFTQNVQAATSMNKWVEEKTANKIHNLISPDDLDDDTAAVLINALYLKGTWIEPFSASSTTKQNFYKTPRDIVNVDMMHAYEREALYFEDKKINAKFLKLPLNGDDISLIIVLPNENESISVLENHIDEVFIPHQFHFHSVNIAIPKFKVETTINFKEVLINLGVKKAFISNEADFSGIAYEKGKLYLDTVRQKTFINVNEGGVEAAAASFVEVIFESASLEPTKDFIANHPFLFYIQIKNLILFGGKISVPQQ